MIRALPGHVLIEPIESPVLDIEMLERILKTNRLSIVTNKITNLVKKYTVGAIRESPKKQIKESDILQIRKMQSCA